MMVAWLKRHVEISTTGGLSCHSQGFDFRVRTTGKPVRTKTDDASLFDDDTADTWIRTCLSV